MKDLSYSQIFYLAKTIGPKLQGNNLSSIGEIGPAKWLLHFSQKISLLVCLKHPFVRFHLQEKKVPSRSTPFCKKIESYLKNQKITSLALLNEDRILQLRFENGFSLIFELFSRGANLYLAGKENLIFLSYVPMDKKVYEPPPKPKEHLLSEVDPSFLSNLESLYQQAEEILSFEQEKEETVKILVSRKKRWEKELQKLEKKTPLFEQALKDAHLLKSHFHLLQKGCKKIELEDWQTHTKQTLLLDPSLSPSEQVAAFFRKASRLKKEEELLCEKKEKIRHALLECANLLKKVEQIPTLHALVSFRKEHPSFFPQKEKAKREFLEFTSASGQKIFVGRNDEENDRLTFSLAKGSDLWLHVADDPGSHVILKTKKNSAMDEESILDAAHLALFYSKAKEQKESHIFIVERKFLSRIKGKRGHVQMSKHRKILIRLDLSRIERLKKALLEAQD